MDIEDYQLQDNSFKIHNDEVLIHGKKVNKKRRKRNARKSGRDTLPFLKEKQARQGISLRNAHS